MPAESETSIPGLRPKLLGRRTLARLAVLLVVLAVLLGWAWDAMIRMPGASFEGRLPALTEGQRALRDELAGHVAVLAGEIGERNDQHPGALAAAARYIESELVAGGWSVERQEFGVLGQRFDNLEAVRRGSRAPNEVLIVGAHYDTARGTPGANDNGSGVAALLALARRAPSRPGRTIRFVAFANEEPPHFQTAGMGSLVYARRCRARRDGVVAMLSLETMGWYSEREGSQGYPFPLGLLYPSRGDFIAFVGTTAWQAQTREVVGAFRRMARFPAEGAAPPASVTGVGWSDHWSFWEQGYPGVMVTDTAPLRFPHYHTARDTPDQVDVDRLARVVDGLGRVVSHLSR